MQGMTVNSEVERHPNHFSRWLWLLAVLIGLMGLALVVYRNWPNRQPELVLAHTAVISSQTLAGQYGLQVNLVAVTAVGGLIDVRLKVLDAAKATPLLTSTSEAIVLLAEDGTSLHLSAEDAGVAATTITDGGSLFFLFPNSQNVVKAGTAVSLVIGTVRLEPIMAQ